MTRDELAQKLHGREYGAELAHPEVNQAKESGLVVIYGAADDLVEITGALDEEVGSYHGGTFQLSRTRVSWGEHVCDCGFCGFPEMLAQFAEVRALWGGSPVWQIETDVQHAKFTIMEEGEPFCLGVVIDLKDLPDVPEPGKPKNRPEMAHELHKQIFELRHAIYEEIKALDQEDKSVESATEAMHRKIELQNVLDRFNP